MPIEIAAHAGFCMGVRRAVESAVQVADSGVPSCTLGELIHNPTVVERVGPDPHGTQMQGDPGVDAECDLAMGHDVAPCVYRIFTCGTNVFQNKISKCHDLRKACVKIGALRFYG